jgi:hypothetical protein
MSQSIGEILNEIRIYNKKLLILLGSGAIIAYTQQEINNLLNVPINKIVFNLTTGSFEKWNGTTWVGLGGGSGASWGSIAGTLSSQTDLQNALTGKADVLDLNAHVSNIGNPHGVTKSQVGLANVDNTSDTNKPISTDTQTALNTKVETVANIGTIGSGLFKDKIGNTLNFRNIVNAGGIGVVINDTNNTIELTNQNSRIIDMTDTFFGTLVSNDLIQWDGTEWVNVQPTTLPISTDVQTALNGKVDKPTISTVQTTNNTPTLVRSIAIPNDTSKGIRFRMKGRSTTGVAYESLCYFAVNNVAGTLTLMSTLTQDRKNLFANSVQNTITISGTNAQINIQGQNGLTINWECYILEIL